MDRDTVISVIVALLYVAAWVTLILSLPLPWYAQLALGFIVLIYAAEKLK